MGKIQKKSGKKKQLECLSVQYFGRLAFSTLTLEERGSPPPNNEKSKNIVKIVNHLVAIAKVIDLQRLSFLFYKKNHLVIVLMVLLCSMLICETPSHKSEKQDKIYAYRQD